MSEDHTRSIFKTMDDMVEQINKTKKVFMILLVTIIIPPVILEIMFTVFDLSYESLHSESGDIIHSIVFIMFIGIWVGLGGRYLIVLNRLTKRYQEFKESQEKLDKKLDE
ncbi:MAG: hypothetical protein IIA19_03135 [Thaumarchaeota archaeon]|nr:hypothetical protein [Nitrososphaerota archaeon]